MLSLIAPVMAEDSVLRQVDPIPADQLWRTGGSLLLMAALIVVVVWFLRRTGAGPRGVGRQIAFIDGLSLGPKERVVLVQVGTEQVLLGVTPGRVERVHVLEHPIEVQPDSEIGFSRALRRAVAASSTDVEKH